MRISLPDIVVTLGEGDDAAELTFARMRANVMQRVMYGLSKANEKREDTFATFTAMAEYNQAILQSCKSVSNLYEDDREVTVEDVQQGNLYQPTIDQIVAKYFVAQRGAQSEVEEKKEEPAGESSGE